MPFEFMIPIVMFIVSGAVVISYIFFRSRERELILSKDYTAEEMVSLLNPSGKKKGVLVVLGILTTTFGLGMLIGTLVDKATGENDYIPFIMFIFVGLGLIISFYVREKLNKKGGE
jgi:Na+/melibiose symporter-like transporter